MNKRVKQLTSFKKQLTVQNKSLKNECTSIKNLIDHEILSEIDIDDARNDLPNEKDEVAIYRKAWRVTDKRNSLKLQQLQNEFKVMSMKKGINTKSKWKGLHNNMSLKVILLRK